MEHDQTETPRRNRRKGCLLRFVVFVGLSFWGASWAWNNRRDVVLDWRCRAEGWYETLREKIATSVPEGPSATGAEEPVRHAAGTPDWQRSDNWTRAKAANIDDLTEEDVALIERWDGDKAEMARMLSETRANMERYASGAAYSFDGRKLAALRRDLDVADHCVSVGDPLRLADRLPALEADARAFMATVRWRQGVSHPTAPHVHSGSRIDTWEPDDGYVFSTGVDGDLSVTYRGHAYRCTRCKGTGSVVRTLSCPQCHGKGVVPNPYVQAGNTAISMLQIANSFSKRPKPMRVNQLRDTGMTCQTCGGHGKIEQAERCPDCTGGTVWR